jgi:uncharacterized protein (DUF58 family)
MWISRSALQLSLIFIFAGIVFGSGPLIGLGVFLLAATLIARYWSNHAFDKLTYERILPENRAFEGESLQLTLRLVNDKLLPLPFVEVRDSVPKDSLVDEEHVSLSTSPGYVFLGRTTHLAWYERINWPVELKAPPRGYYRIGPGRITTGDMFGFFPIVREDDTYSPVIIYPRIYSMPELGLPAARPFGERKGRERIFEDPSRIAGLRDYQPGDPMRRIDWKASARMQALQSKVYEPSATMHMLIAMNVNTMEHSWEGYVPATLERLLSVAGSVANEGIDAGYAVGLVANGSFRESDRPMRIPVGRTAGQLSRILEALAVIGPLTLSPLADVIDREAHSFPFGATLVCVTARMEEPLAASLRRVAGAGHTVTVLSLSQEEFEADLGSIPVAYILDAVRAVEVRDASERSPSPRDQAEPVVTAPDVPLAGAPKAQLDEAPVSPFARPRP